MKITAIILLSACLTASANGFSQKITLSEKNARLEKIFSSIQRQTGYEFLYTYEMLQKAQLITIELKSTDLQVALDKIFKDQPLTYAIIVKTVVVKPKSAQNNAEELLPPPPIDVKGRILNENGEPVIATITEKGTKNVATSDTNGYFELKAIDENATLVVTGVNIESIEIKVKGQVNLSITTKTKIVEGAEVIVHTGYETISTKISTGAYEKVDNDLLRRSVSPNIIDRLNGVTTGLLFDRRFNLAAIRGISTLTSSIQSPLIILDNFPYEGSITNINPNDIEEITILKDAAASAIWGAKAGNGVIVITSKKGQFNQKLKIGFTSNVTVTNKDRVFDDKNFLNSKDFISVEKYLFDRGFYNSDLNNRTTYPVISPVVEVLAAQRSGAISSGESERIIDSLSNQDIRSDYLNYLRRIGLNQQYSLSISGGGSNIAYTFFVGNDRMLSSLIGNSSNRLVIKSSNIYRPIKQIEISFGITYTESNSTNNSPGGTISIASQKSIYPYARLVDAQGNPVALQKDYRMSYTDTAGAGKLLDWKYNPINEIDAVSRGTINRHILLQTGIRYKWSSFLNIDVRYQFENGNSRTDNYNSPSSYFARNLVNLYTQNSGGSLVRNIPAGGIIDLSNSSFIAHSARIQTNARLLVQKAHEISGIIGTEIRQTNRISNSTRAYGYDREILSYSNVNFNISYPSYNNLRSNNFIPNNLSFDNTLDRFVSFYTNANYSYSEKYVLSLSARKDASNLFGVSTNNKWKPLWSVGGAWNLHKEKFLLQSKISNLKLRYTYGYSGNVNNSRAAVVTFQQQNPQASSLNGLPYAQIVNRPNAELRWETVRTSNLGIDFRSHSGRVSVTADYYVKKSYDLFSLVPVDITTTGTSEMMKNSAVLKGQGADISISTLNIKKAIEWKTTILFSSNKTVVKEYFKPQAFPSLYVNSGSTITPIKEELAYNIISYKWAGLNPQNGNPRGYLNGQVSENYNQIISMAGWEDVVLHGSSIPLYFGSIRNELSFKGLSLSANILFRHKYYYRRNSINYSSLFSSWIGHMDYEKRWQAHGDEINTDVPSMIYPADSRRDQFYSSSSALVERADNIRLQDIRISYDFKRKNLKTRGGQIYFYSNNLGFIWRKNKFKDDPDTSDKVSLPSSYSFGINLNL